MKIDLRVDDSFINSQKGDVMHIRLNGEVDGVEYDKTFEFELVEVKNHKSRKPKVFKGELTYVTTKG